MELRRVPYNAKRRKLCSGLPRRHVQALFQSSQTKLHSQLPFAPYAGAVTIAAFDARRPSTGRLENTTRQFALPPNQGRFVPRSGYRRFVVNEPQFNVRPQDRASIGAAQPARAVNEVKGLLGPDHIAPREARARCAVLLYEGSKLCVEVAFLPSEHDLRAIKPKREHHNERRSTRGHREP